MTQTGDNNANTIGSFLESNLRIDGEAVNQLLRHCRRLKVKRGDFALQEGMTCRHAFFVEQGLLKEYSIDDRGRYNVLLFAPENWFLCNVETMFFQSPSSFFIQAIEDSTLLLIDADTLEMLEHSYPEFADFRQRLLHAHVRELELRVSQLMAGNAEARYLDFINRHNDLAFRLSQLEIASYLGIAPESLSRIKKDLAERRCKPRERKRKSQEHG